MKVTSTGRDRRVFPRISPGDLTVPASIRIPSRPPVSLVDLSSGGALIDLPFQIGPTSRLTVELVTGSQRQSVPIQLLRCYVTSLKDGVRYQAAGAFETALRLPGLMRNPARTPTNQLASTLEAFLRHDGIGGGNARVREFDHLLGSVLEAVQRGDPAARISLEIRSRLAALIPSLTMEPATTAYLPDPSRGARFFGIDFKARNVLTAVDRRLLRAAAQILSIVSRDIPSESTGADPAPAADSSPAIAYSIADWQEMCRQDAPLAR